MIEYINKLEKHYYKKIKTAFENNGMSIMKTLSSAFPIKETWEDYDNKKSPFQEGLERCVQSTLSKEYDWEICSTPVGADSVFITPKAIIHIDAKCVLKTDRDAISNQISIRKNQTSYATEKSVVHDNKEFESNLPTVYEHKIYGNLICLTYFLKIIYEKNYDSAFWNSCSIQLCSVPNGKLRTVYKDDFFLMGKNRNVLLDKYLSNEDYKTIKRKCDAEQKKILSESYDKYDEVYLIKEHIYSDEEEMKILEALYKNNHYREPGDRSKKVRGEQWKKTDYVVLNSEIIEYLYCHYNREHVEDILDRYEHLKNIFLLKLSLKAEEKTILKNNVYKKIELNTFCDSLRVKFDELNKVGEGEFLWDRSEKLELY